MSKKEYYCKDCKEHNNGWCPHLKRNGLKEITKETCEAEGGKKTSKIQVEDIAPVEEKVPNSNEQLRIEKRKKELFEFLKDNLSLEVKTREGIKPGSKIAEITILFDEEPITDTDFYIKE